MSTALTTHVVPPLAQTEAVADRSGAGSDRELVDLWLSTKRSPHTRRAYRQDVDDFLAFLEMGRLALRNLTVSHLQAWADQVTGATSTRARRISAVRSLLTFGHRTGYLHFNVGQVVEAPQVPNDLAERILTEAEVHKLIDATRAPRECALVRFLYGSGVRIAELCVLRWCHIHIQDSGEASVTVHGKGSKTRHILVSEKVVEAITAIRAPDADDDSPVFATRSGRPLHPANAAKIVQGVARRAGIARKISPHWFRHAHASHALDRGAPVHLVQAQLGHASLATTGRYTHARPTDGTSRYLAV